MKNIIKIILIVGFISLPCLFAEEGAVSKKVVMIIAEQNFRDEELLHTKEVLENSSIKVIVASTTLAEAKGMLGAKAKPNILVSQIKADDFDALIFVGGTGSSQYWDDSFAHKLARDMNAQGKVVAAICIAPVTLANAGLLRGKKATVFSSEAGQLKKAGAVYTGVGVEIDGNIITADGPSSAKKFGEAIATVLKK